MKIPNKKVAGKAGRILKKSGWVPGRDKSEIIDAYEEKRGCALFPEAREFLRSFGGIEVGGCLWLWRGQPDHFVTTLENRVADVAGVAVVPVASSNYLSCTCTIWIDALVRFYAVDEEGLVYLASSPSKLFDVLLTDGAKEDPPSELAEKLKKAYEWD